MIALPFWQPTIEDYQPTDQDWADYGEYVMTQDEMDDDRHIAWMEEVRRGY